MIDPSLIAFVGSAALLTVLPGVDTALVAQVTFLDGKRAAFFTSLGFHVALGIAWLTTYAYAIDRLGRIVQGARRRLERVTGLPLIGLGVRLALERRQATRRFLWVT